MLIRYVSITLLACTLLAGCSGDDSSGPGSLTGPGESVNWCGWTADVTGGLSGSWDGEVARVSTLSGATEIVFRSTVDGMSGPTGLVVFEQQLADGETGSFPIAAVLQISATEVVAASPGTTMDVTRSSGGILEGTFQASTASGGGQTVTWEMSFVAGRSGNNDPCYE